MRIGVDGYNLAMPKGTGVATYGFELTATLAAMGHSVEGVFGLAVPAEVAMREVAFFDGYWRANAPARTRRWRRRADAVRSLAGLRARDVALTGFLDRATLPGRFPSFSRFASVADLFYRAHRHFQWTGRFLSLSVEQPPEIMHWTYPVPVKLKGSRNIYTLHDLVPLKLPWTTLDNKQSYAALAARCVRDAAQICTVSEASERDIVDRFPAAAGKIVNTYQIAADADMRPTDSAEADARLIESAFELKHRTYFLYYGAIEPKKNIGRIVEAYLRLDSATPLVIVGGIGWSSEEELRLIPGEGATGATGNFVTSRGQRIVRLDHLPRKLLAKLIRGAKAVVFPSLYEGFGLPVLEAMQLGTPVITSNTSSLPEVAGDAALLVDPYDVQSISEAMRAVDQSPALCDDLAARGLVQASIFSPEHYRERLTTLYARAMQTRHV